MPAGRASAIPAATTGVISLGTGKIDDGWLSDAIARSADLAATSNFTVIQKTANYTILPGDKTILVDATAGNLVITLPNADDAQFHQYTVKKIDGTANTVTVQRAGSAEIDGATTFVLTNEHESVTMHGDGVDFWVIAHYGAAISF